MDATIVFFDERGEAFARELAQALPWEQQVINPLPFDASDRSHEEVERSIYHQEEKVFNLPDSEEHIFIVTDSPGAAASTAFIPLSESPTIVYLRSENFEFYVERDLLIEARIFFGLQEISRLTGSPLYLIDMATCEALIPPGWERGYEEGLYRTASDILAYNIASERIPYKIGNKEAPDRAASIMTVGFLPTDGSTDPVLLFPLQMPREQWYNFLLPRDGKTEAQSIKDVRGIMRQMRGRAAEGTAIKYRTFHKQATQAYYLQFRSSVIQELERREKYGNF